MVCEDPANQQMFWILLGVASLLGVTGLLPVGGGDMPVMISFLNSLSGIAAMLTGFVIKNTMLIVGGSLVGASGIILTTIRTDIQSNKDLEKWIQFCTTVQKELRLLPELAIYGKTLILSFYYVYTYELTCKNHFNGR